MTTIEQLNLMEDENATDLWRLQHAAYRVEAERIGVADLPPLHDTVATLRASEEAFWSCRDDDGELIGAVSAERTGEGKALICRLMVDPEHFREGIASRLLEHLLEAWQDVRLWRVTAEARNRPAIALYERFGFKQEERFHPRSDITMIVMRRHETKT